MANIRFIHGKRYKFYCNKCGCKREGIYFREAYDARAKLSCGHHRNLGYTMPMDELEAEGLLNVEPEKTLEDDTDSLLHEELLKRSKKLITRKSIYY